ncbi:unnamed protein product [Leptidea sinapis]|uniref:Uncharacterized protein n=1 Tax=Leptidea sinapis TaxID=189913 RepID=A0A5E4QJX9_9NEOP|nr:unnamed protein product [Leptidea sinapis]
MEMCGSAPAAAPPARSEGSAAPRAVVAPLVGEAAVVVAAEVPAAAAPLAVVLEAGPVVRAALEAAPAPVAAPVEPTEPTTNQQHTFVCAFW